MSIVSNGIYFSLLGEIPKVNNWPHVSGPWKAGNLRQRLIIMLLHQWWKGRSEQLILCLHGSTGVADLSQSCLYVGKVGVMSCQQKSGLCCLMMT